MHKDTFKMTDDKSIGLENPAFDRGPTDLENDLKTQQSSNTQLSKPVERSQWGNGNEFLMSCIAMSIGLGNIWRFPFIANKNGGGAFLIPYLITLTVIGRPMYYLEMILGQFSSRGSIKMYSKLSPVLKGIGYGQILGTFFCASYYAVITAITLVYFFNSFTSSFPWATCQDRWQDYLYSRNITCVDQFSNGTDTKNGTITSSEMYFRRDVLDETDDISDGIGLPNWRLALLLFFTWTITFLISVKGVKSSGKASYFLAIFPYVIMIILFIRSVTLDGAVDGMLYFIKADFSKLLKAEVWYAAVTQCFFSLGVSFGQIITFSSYNRFDHDINRDAFIITTLDTFTSLLSGFTIFGILGNLAHELNVPPSEVISKGGGTGLAFVSYPDAISKFTFVPWAFSITFFFMLFVLGIGTLVAAHATVITSIKDAFINIPDWIIASVTAFALFSLGLVYTTSGGQYVLDLVDHFGGTFVVFICAILETLAIIFLYGINNLCMDVEFMTKRKVGIYWRITWGLAMPIFLIAIFIYFVGTLKPMVYGIYSLSYPLSLTVMGWSLVGLVVLQMIFWLLYYMYKHKNFNIKQMISNTFSTSTWEPDDPKVKEDWKKYRQDASIANTLKRRSWFRRKLKTITGL